jgi:hypothetical protein
MHFIKTTAAASLLALVAATPVAIADPVGLQKRAGEGIHLVNCAARSFLVVCPPIPLI